MEYRQHVDRANLSLECNTAAVPQDGHYYVIHNAKIVGRYKTLKQAQVKYRRVLEALRLPPLARDASERRQAQARAAAQTVVDDMERETFYRAAAKRRKGNRTRTFG